MRDDKPTLEQLGGDFSEDTKQWFDAWRDSPRTDGWDAAQWQYMKDTAVIHSCIYSMNMIELFPDLDKRLSKLGLSFDAPSSAKSTGKVTTLEIIQGRRADRVARAKGEARAS